MLLATDQKSDIIYQVLIFLSLRFITKLLISLFLITFTSNLTTSAIKIECTYPDPNFFWAVFDRAYTCDGIVVMDGDDDIVTSVSHSHRHPLKNEHVYGLVIVHQRSLEKFPRGIESHFRYLKGIDLEGCGLTRISSEDLRPFKDLLQISLDENRLTELPHDLFQHNLKLQRIDIEGNLLYHVGLEIFSNLHHLSVVYMKHNACTSENSFALRHEELKELAWELSVECPPTLSMLSNSLFGSNKFVENVRKISSENSEEVREELMMKIEELERKIQEIKRRL
jgi:Leucine-rich repeat (LRR) protein